MINISIHFLKILSILLNHSEKTKKIEFNARRFSRDFPKITNPLSVKF